HQHHAIVFRHIARHSPAFSGIIAKYSGVRPINVLIHRHFKFRMTINPSSTNENGERTGSFPFKFLRLTEPIADFAFERRERFAAARCSILEESVLRPRQAKMLAQSRALVVTPKQSPSLQFGHDTLDEIVAAARQVRKHNREAARSFRVKPLFHLIGDRARRADHRQAGIAAEPLRQLTHCQALAPGKRDSALPSALRSIALRYFLRQRSVWIEFRS